MTDLVRIITNPTILKSFIDLARNIFFPSKIEITSHSPGETWKSGEKDEVNKLYSVSIKGTQSKITPKNHELWLITEDNEKFFPQDRKFILDEKHKWSGRIVIFPGEKIITVHVVIAPITSQILFRHYFKVSEIHKIFHPLEKIPEECRIKTSMSIKFDLPKI